MLDTRKMEERDFHNRLEIDRRSMEEDEYDKKYRNLKFYAITRKTSRVIDAWIQAHCPGRVALDYACGLGTTSVRMAKKGAFVHGIDISEEAVRTAAAAAAREEVGGKTRFSVMDAENMTFKDETFDVAVCSAILHHLTAEKAFRELSRVLKKDGRILCIEALGYNPLIKLYRRMTPGLRTSWEPDHILTLREVNVARKYFNKVRVQYFYLFSILAVPFRSTRLFLPILTALEKVDAAVLKIPYVQLLAWQMIFELSEPKKG